jgi:hypothetical protein
METRGSSFAQVRSGVAQLTLIRPSGRSRNYSVTTTYLPLGKASTLIYATGTRPREVSCTLPRRFRTGVVHEWLAASHPCGGSGDETTAAWDRQTE